MTHQPLSTDGVHPLISSSLRLLVPCLVRPNSFVIHYCWFIFSNNSFPLLAPLTNATPAFSTVWLHYCAVTANSFKRKHMIKIKRHRMCSLILDYAINLFCQVCKIINLYISVSIAFCFKLSKKAVFLSLELILWRLKSSLDRPFRLSDDCEK